MMFHTATGLRRHVLLWGIGLFMLAASLLSAHQAQASSVYVLDSLLIRQDGQVYAGSFDVRLSLWNTPSPDNAIDRGRDGAGNTVLNLHSPNFTGYVEEHAVTTATNGSFNVVMGRLVELEPVFTDGIVYLQLDAKPNGTDQTNWRRMQLSGAEGRERLAIRLSDLRTARIRFDSDYGSYSGVLVDKDGKPSQGRYVARFSLWGSPNFDPGLDKLKDGSIRSAATNYLGYNLELPFTTDQFGRFVLHVGPFNNEFIPRDLSVFVQVEIRAAEEPMSQFDLIDPDGNLESTVDRYSVKDGGLMAEDAGNVTAIGDSEKLLVSNIPGGTTSRYFELGVGDALPVGYYEIRVRQADGKAASLRYNAVEKIWEVSNDGVIFTPIGAFIRGTPFSSFTIGLGNRGNEPMELQFGDGLSPGRFGFDPARNVFFINKPIDFGQQQLLNAVLENRSSPPTNPVAGQEYFDTSDKTAYYFNGALWVAMGWNASTSSAPQNIIPVSSTAPVVNTVTSTTPITWDAIPTRNKSYTFLGEALGSALVTAANTKGTVAELHDAVEDKNFYRWTTKQSTMQRMDLMLEWMVPEDFTGFQAQPFEVLLRTPTTDASDAKIDVSLQKGGNTIALTNATDMMSGTNNVWNTRYPNFTTTPSVQPGDRLTIVVSLYVTEGMTADLGAVTVNYLGK